MGVAFSNPEAPPKVVLVPPLLDSRERGRSKFAKSSYDRSFGQPQLRILFGDYLSPLLVGGLRFSPPEDERISVAAKLRVSPLKRPEGGNSTSIERAQTGSLTLRYQPDADTPWTFCDIKARTQGVQSTAMVRGCYFHPRSGIAAFSILPLLTGDDTSTSSHKRFYSSALRVGVKYSSPSCSIGGIISPASNALNSAWVLGRVGGLILGCQTAPSNGSFTGITNALSSGEGYPGVLAAFSDFSHGCSQAASWAAAYQPAGQSAYGKGIFTAVVELQQQKQLNIAFLHHMAVQRNVHNPLEKSDVVGISNYLDIGLQMVVDLTNNTTSGSGSGASTISSSNSSAMRLAASWQANKNVMLKARAGMDGFAAAFVFKSWWQPAFTFGLAYSKDFSATASSSSNSSSKPRFGVTMNFETYKQLRYERSAEGLKMSGARITQRHVASEEDVAYHEGQGLLVPLSEVDNPEVLGHRQPAGAEYL